MALERGTNGQSLSKTWLIAWRPSRTSSGLWCHWTNRFLPYRQWWQVYSSSRQSRPPPSLAWTTLSAPSVGPMAAAAMLPRRRAIRSSPPSTRWSSRSTTAQSVRSLLHGVPHTGAQEGPVRVAASPRRRPTMVPPSGAQQWPSRLDPLHPAHPNPLRAATHGQPNRGAGPAPARRLGGRPLQTIHGPILL
jgi:hypothetical protein